jgi:outer membrane protein assembly factor BamB
MFNRILKSVLFLLLGTLAVGGVLYQFFGLRAVLTGGGMPRLRFVESSEAQAERIARHRQEQRAKFATVAGGEAPTTQPEVSPADTAKGDDALAIVAPAAPELGVTSRAVITPPYWTDFRGPRRDGVYSERPLLTAWPASGLQPIWKQPSGAGYASFVIARGRAFTIEQRGPEEVVAAYDVGTGRELWTNAWRAEFRESMGGDGPRATPTWSDGRVYALGAEGELRVLDEATGRAAWRTNILEGSGATNLQWGMSASPLVVDDMVIVQPGGPAGQSVAAYNKATGRPVWSSLGDQQSYASPMLVTLLGVRQVVVFTATRLVGITVEKGDELWDFTWPGPNGINAAQPLIIGENRIFLSSGYGMGAAVVEISKGAAGFTVREVWRNTRMKNRFASSVLHDGFIYGLDESILACLDAATGELKWKGGRYGYGQLMLASGHLIVLTEDGDIALVRATPARHEEVSRFSALSGKTWNPPAIGDGRLLVRNLAEMAAFDLRVK